MNLCGNHRPLGSGITATTATLTASAGTPSSLPRKSQSKRKQKTAQLQRKQQIAQPQRRHHTVQPQRGQTTQSPAHAQRRDSAQPTIQAQLRNTIEATPPNTLQRKLGVMSTLNLSSSEENNVIETTDAKKGWGTGKRFMHFVRKPEGDAWDDDRNDSEGQRPSTSEDDGGRRQYDSDLTNMEVLYDEHDEDPYEVLDLVTFDTIPLPTPKEDVVLSVEASTVSPIDCEIRRGEYKPPGYQIAFPLVPGFECVGKIVKCGDKARDLGFKERERVACLLIQGGNRRYVTVPSEDLVKVPKNVDPAEAVCMINTYVSAFQSLMHERPLSIRHAPRPLKDKRILIISRWGQETRALVDLAVALGSERVYCLARKSDHSEIIDVGGRPLNVEDEEWLPKLEGKIDLAIDSICIDGYESTRSVLKPTGRLVATGMSAITEEGAGSLLSSIELMWTETSVRLMKQGSLYRGVVDSWNSKPEEYKIDLHHVLGLLSRQKIRPKIYRRIPLRKVPVAHRKIDKSFHGDLDKKGLIVCEPWLL